MLISIIQYRIWIPTHLCFYHTVLREIIIAVNPAAVLGYLRGNKYTVPTVQDHDFHTEIRIEFPLALEFFSKVAYTVPTVQGLPTAPVPN